jgi:hypothetical protein
MNDQTQTLIRSVFKILGGAFVARGLATDDNMEVIIAGLTTLAAVIWGYFHRTPQGASAGGSSGSAKIPALAFLAIGCMALMGCLVGCKTPTLEAGGIYAGHLFWYQADRTLSDARTTLDNFVMFEYQNRAALASNHLSGVTAAADGVRTNAPRWFEEAAAARSVYTNLLLSATPAPAASLASASNEFSGIVVFVTGKAATAAAIAGTNK